MNNIFHRKNSFQATRKSATRQQLHLFLALPLSPSHTRTCTLVFFCPPSQAHTHTFFLSLSIVHTHSRQSTHSPKKFMRSCTIFVSVTFKMKCSDSWEWFYPQIPFHVQFNFIAAQCIQIPFNCLIFQLLVTFSFRLALSSFKRCSFSLFSSLSLSISLSLTLSHFFLLLLFGSLISFSFCLSQFFILCDLTHMFLLFFVSGYSFSLCLNIFSSPIQIFYMFFPFGFSSCTLSVSLLLGSLFHSSFSQISPKGFLYLTLTEFWTHVVTPDSRFWKCSTMFSFVIQWSCHVLLDIQAPGWSPKLHRTQFFHGWEAAWQLKLLRAWVWVSGLVW